MRLKYFVLSLIVSSLISFNSFAAQMIDCYQANVSYDDQGRVTLTDDNGNIMGTYDNTEAMLADVFGLNISANWNDVLTNFNNSYNSSNSSSSSSSKTRGRLIYSVEEANAAVRDGAVNKIRLRYK